MIHRCSHCGLEVDAPPSAIPYMHIECANAGFYNEMEPQPQPSTDE